jgi:hypothetical protein
VPGEVEWAALPLQAAEARKRREATGRRWRIGCQ